MENGDSVSTIGELSAHIDENLLKGIPLSKVLRHCGNAFKSNKGHQTDFLKSLLVASLDEFISHDWHSSRIAKTLTLCIIHNSQAAMAVSTCVGAILLVMQNKFMLAWLSIERPHNENLDGFHETRLEFGMWSQLLCPLVFIIVFLYWQQIREGLRMNVQIVFLDKFCIDQLDREKKAAGILGLAGFLSKTERLVICWTPRYFTRLWCTYEVASWLYLKKPFDSVLLFPLATGVTIVALGCFMQAIAIIFHFGSVLTANYILLSLAIYVAVAPIGMHVFRHLVKDLRALPQQIQDFSIASSGCFCCTVNHQMPGTGELLPCDRPIVFKTIKRWFPDEPSGVSASSPLYKLPKDREVINKFDMSIRELFGPFILRSAGPTRFAYQHIVVAAMPYWWKCLDVSVAFGAIDFVTCVFTLLETMILAFAIVPCGLKLVFYMLILFDKCIGIPRNTCLDFLCSIVAALASMFVLFSLWLPLTLSGALRGVIGRMVFLTVCIFLVLLTLVLYLGFDYIEMRQQKVLELSKVAALLKERESDAVKVMALEENIASNLQTHQAELVAQSTDDMAIEEYDIDIEI